MIAQKRLTIKEIKNEIKKIENELDLYLTKRNLNYLKTQPGAMQIRDVVVDSSHVNYDSFLNYAVKDEEYDTKIYSLIYSLYSYKAYLAKEIQRLSKYDEIGYITYLREEEHKSWYDIDKTLNHSPGYSKLKFNRFKKQKKRRVNSK